MRALCGAIITAGALLSLGLISIGMGYRYAAYPYLDPSTNQPQRVALHNTDTGLLVAFIAALICVAIGLGIAFLGLAYHHHRRYMEMLHRHGAAGTPASPASPGGPSERITV